MMIPRFAFSALFALCTLSTPFFCESHATTIIKANNANDLNQTNSWVTNGPPSSADVATWDATVTAVNTCLLGADMTWGGITVGVGSNPGGNVAITIGNTLTLGPSGIVLSSANRNLTLNCDVALNADQVWSAGTVATRLLTISGNISGNQRLTKDGVGTLILTGANTYAGGTVVTNGILSIDADESLGNATAPLIFAASGTLTLTGAGTYGTNRTTAISNAVTATYSTTVEATWAGEINGAGALTKSGSGTLILSGTNTYTGTTLISAGALRANDTLGLPASGNVNIAGGIWETAANITRNTGTAAGELQIGAGSSGFSAFGSPVTVSLNGGAALTWGNASFAPTTALVLNSTTANNGITLANGLDLNNAAARTLTVNANNAILAGTLSNTLAGGLTKNGNGRLVLAGTNTYTGATTVSAGPLQAAAGTGLPGGNLAITATGIFEPIGGITRELGTNAAQVQITGAAASGFSAQGSNATIAIAGTITWGGTTFNPSPLILNATDATHDLFFQGNLDLNGAGRVIQVTTNTATVSGIISHSTGSSRLQKTGIGALILSATNTWTHTQTFATNLYVSVGTLQISQEENLGGTPASFQAKSLMLDGGTLRTTATFTIDDANRGINLGAADGRFNVDAGTTLTVMNVVTGANLGVLFKEGPGTLLLGNSANTYGQGARTEMLAGILQIANDGNLGTPAADVTLSGDSTLFATGTTTINSGRTINLNTNWTVNVTNGVVLTIAGIVNESVGSGGALTKTGAGTLIFSDAGNSNDWNGLTLIAEGTIKLGAANTLPNTAAAGGDVSIASGALLDMNGFSATMGSIIGAGTIDNTVSGGPYTNSVGNNATSTTFSGLIQNTAGTLALTKVGAGTLTLNTPHTYSGNTTVTTGTLKLGASNVIPNGVGKENVTVNALLDLAGFNETINGLAGAGVITNSTGAATLAVGDNDASTAYTGTFRDGGGILAITKIGAGVLTISGANTHSGDTTVSNGILRISGGSAIPDGPGRGNVAVATGGTLDVNTAESINGLWGAGTINNSIASARLLTAGANDQSSTFSGTIMNTGAPASLGLVKIGAGTLILSGTNTYGGGTTISGGTLQLGNGGASGSLPNAPIANTATLAFNRSDAYIFGSVVSGAGGALVQNGSGTITLTNANTYTGPTTINAGTLQIGQAGDRIANTSPLIINNGIVDLQNFNETVSNVTLVAGGIIGTGVLTGSVYTVQSGTISASLGGAGALVKSTGGTVILSAANTYAGGTTINSGLLVVSNTTGSATGGGPVSVNSGATLGGPGFIAGAVTVNSGGALSPGASVGTLTVGSLTMAAGATNVFEFGPGMSNDQIIVTSPGGLTLNGGSFLLVASGTTTPWTTSGTYPVIQFTGGLGGVGLSALSVSNPQPGKEYNFALLGNWVVLIISDLGIPEVTNANGASGIASHAAQLNGFLVSTGGAPTSVSIYWGTLDGGTNPAAWTYTNGLGTRIAGGFSLNTPPPWLQASQTYFYRCFAANANGSDWADSTTNFTTLAESDSTELAIDADILDATAEHGPSPNVVFINYSMGYVVYVDADSNVVYRKTVDGGATWGNAVSLGDNQGVGNVSVWYDRWTPGDTGDTLHLAHIGSSADTLRYNTLNTANDTAGTWISVRTGAAWTAPSAGCTITKSTTGRRFISQGPIISHSDDGTTWTAADIGDPGAGIDAGQLLPLTSGDVLLLQVRAGAVDRLRTAVWTNSLGAWSTWTTNAAVIEADATYLSQWGAALDHLSGDVFVAVHTDVNGASGALTLYKFSDTTRALMHVSDIVADTARQITSVSLLADKHNGDLYAVYARQNGAIVGTNPTNVYLHVRHSADGGAFWSAETPISNLASQDIRIVRGSLMGGERLYATWFDEDDNDLFGNTAMDLSPTRLRINSGPVANILPHSATLYGNLVSEGASPADVWVYWGQTNAGTSATLWENSLHVGTPGTGTLAIGVSGLAHITTYFYRYYATNAQGEAWADTTPSFKTPLDFVMIGGTNYFGKNMDYEINYGFSDGNASHGWHQGSGDGFSYSSAQQGITPIPGDGVQMMRFDAADSDGINCDVQQDVTVSNYVAAITNGNAFCQFTTMANTVQAGASIEIHLAFYNQQNLLIGNHVRTFNLDGDTDSWEEISATFGQVSLPAQTYRITLAYKLPAASTGGALSGHYADQARLSLIFPILDRPPPTGLILIVK